MDDQTEFARFNMIQQQIRPWGVLDERVLEVMSEVPREAFVADAYRGLAYADIEVPIGATGRMLAPKVVARLLQAVRVGPGDRVLEIGTGTGYLTACLSRLGGWVLSLEIDPDLAEAARARLAELQVTGVEIRTADGLAGPNEGDAPFDVIAVTGSMPTEDSLPLLQGQLAMGGRCFCVIGEDPVMQARLITRVGTQVYRQDILFETSIPVLDKVVAPVGFVF